MSHKPRGKFDPAKLGKAQTVKLTSKEHALASKQIAAADREHPDCRVNFRWGAPQVEMLKRVADLMGVSYQQYIKQVLFRQVQEDLRKYDSPT